MYMYIYVFTSGRNIFKPTSRPAQMGLVLLHVQTGLSALSPTQMGVCLWPISVLLL